MRRLLGRAVVAHISRTTAFRVHRATEQVAVALGLQGLLIVALLDGREAILMVLGARCGQKVDNEAPHVEDEDKTDDPLDRGGDVVALLAQADDGEGDD